MDIIGPEAKIREFERREDTSILKIFKLQGHRHLAALALLARSEDLPLNTKRNTHFTRYRFSEAYLSYIQTFKTCSRVLGDALKVCQTEHIIPTCSSKTYPTACFNQTSGGGEHRGESTMASVTSLDKDMKNIRLSKYTPQAANEVRMWIEDALGERLKPGDLLEALKDGVALCK